MGETELPGSQGPGRVGGRVACRRGVLPGVSPPFLPPRLWPTAGDQPGPTRLFGAHDEVLRTGMALDRVQATDQCHGRQPPSTCFREGGLRLETTEKRGASCCKAGTGWAVASPSSAQPSPALLGSSDHGIDLLVLWHGPRRQRAMPPQTAVRGPGGVPFGARFGGTPAPGKRACRLSGSPHPGRSTHYIWGKSGKRPSSPPWALEEACARACWSRSGRQAGALLCRR
jgi:hypothetical protein